MANTNPNTVAIDINPFVKIASHMTRLGFYAVSQDHFTCPFSFFYERTLSEVLEYRLFSKTIFFVSSVFYYRCV